MGRFDYPDPGVDPEYCNGLAPYWPEDRDTPGEHGDRIQRARRSGDVKSWRLVWSPEGRTIATVRATTRRSAIAQAPKPYRRYRGEIYAEVV